MKRTALVVLGMHESGPALLAWVLHRLGAGLPQDLSPSDAGPHDAIWGSARLARLNESILQACDEDGSNAASVASDALEAHSRGMLGKQAAAFLQCHCGDADAYVLHDARLTRVLPFWLPVLRQAGHAVRFVVVARQPHAVADALATTRSLDPESVYLMWLGHLLDAERDTRGASRVFVTYEACVGDLRSCIDAIIQALGLPWAHPYESIAGQTALFLPAAPNQGAERAAPQHLIARCRRRTGSWRRRDASTSTDRRGPGPRGYWVRASRRCARGPGIRPPRGRIRSPPAAPPGGRPRWSRRRPSSLASSSGSARRRRRSDWCRR